MSERLAAIGGRLSLGQGGLSGRGFRLVATVPQAQPPASADGQRGEALLRAAGSVQEGSGPPPAANVGVQPG
jgi:hypothetical protein